MNIKDKIEEIESDEKMPNIYILHSLLELAMRVTGLGDDSEDYTNTIYFPLGDMTINCCEYYGTLSISDEESDEVEISEGNEELILKLIKEIKKRILDYDKEIKKIREKASEKIFYKPLNKDLKEKLFGEREEI